MVINSFKSPGMAIAIYIDDTRHPVGTGSTSQRIHRQNDIRLVCYTEEADIRCFNVSLREQSFWYTCHSHNDQLAVTFPFILSLHC